MFHTKQDGARAVSTCAHRAIAVLSKTVRAGFPSPADDYLDAPIDLSRTLIQNAPAIFIMTVASSCPVPSDTGASPRS